MTIKRRQLLQIAGLTCAANPLGTLLANPTAETYLQFVVVKDDQALPEFAAGDTLLADTRQTLYSGEGVYLYPHWGEPRPYHVNIAAGSAHGPLLEFRNPGTLQLLWAQAPGLDNRFAGRITDHFTKQQLASKTLTYPALSLQALPISTDETHVGFNMPGTV